MGQFHGTHLLLRIEIVVTGMTRHRSFACCELMVCTAYAERCALKFNWPTTAFATLNLTLVMKILDSCVVCSGNSRAYRQHHSSRGWIWTN